MPDNRSTEKPSEQQPLDTEDWEIAFAPYKGDTSAALNMGFNLMVMKVYLSPDPPNLQEALEGIDHAIEALYPYTQFHVICHNMYFKVVGGDLSLEEEEMLKKLGIKF